MVKKTPTRNVLRPEGQDLKVPVLPGFLGNVFTKRAKDRPFLMGLGDCLGLEDLRKKYVH